jgi:1,4-dihydroxy-2-naphthoate octaprenyltransferase
MDAKALKHWLAATRPRTLPLAAVPVLVGGALAWMDRGGLDLPVWGATLAAALLIQIGTNLHNDVADFERGVDHPKTRLGPPRATSQGWLSAAQVQRGAMASFGAAMGVGAYLVWVGGWPILLVGLCSMAAAWAYTGGPRPVAYTGLGEVFVFVFFGLVAVCGSYYLQTGGVAWSAVVAGAMIGSGAAAVLVVNNYRDLDNDRAVGKHTLAVRLGRRATQIEYGLLLLLPFLLLPLLRGGGGDGRWLVLPLAMLPWAAYLLWRFITEPPGRVFNHLLDMTAQFQLGFGGLLCLALVLGRGAA